MSADAPAVPFSAQSLLGETNGDLTPQQQIPKPKRKRNGPGKPDPMAEVVALSAERLLATGIYVCEVCNSGFERDQNLQLHRRRHNLAVSLKKSGTHKNRKRVYVCPVPSCVYHDPTRALGDITGIKKHYLRKHCERKWRCEKCNKMYAIESDMKVHFKQCSSGKFSCEKCGKEFSRKRSCATHQKDCNVANPAGVPMMPDEGGNDASNVGTVSNASHPLMSPSFANFNELGMGSMNVDASWTSTGGYAVGGEWSGENNYAGDAAAGGELLGDALGMGCLGTASCLVEMIPVCRRRMSWLSWIGGCRQSPKIYPP